MPDKHRIAIFVATSGHSGVDRAMQHLIPSLAEKGYPVDLLKVRKHGPQLRNEPKGVRVIDLGSSHVYSSLPAVVRYLRREKPHVLLSDKDRVNRTALLARRLANVPTRTVLSSGTTISVDLASRGWFDRWIQRNSMGHLYRFADNVIVTSAGVADDMAEYTGLDRRRIEVVPSPVIPQAFIGSRQPKPDHPWFQEGEPPVILGTGELCARKDFQMLLHAFAKVRSIVNCRLMILGKGKHHDQLLQLAKQLSVDADFELAGFKSNPYPYMAHASLFAFTSRWEGLGFVLIEALALGVPVVSTDCPSGPREILADGKYGRLVPVGNADQMSHAIIETLANPSKPEFLRQAAEPYTVENSTRCYLHALGVA